MKKIITVVLPGYNCSSTLIKTYEEIDKNLVDHIVYVDDKSNDNSLKIAKSLGLIIVAHSENIGYGGNQKTCFNKALELNSDIIILLHPDYQYTPRLIPSMIAILNSELYDIVLASRILGRGALQGGMPIYKYISNRALTLFQNILLGQKLSEYHTGYRAYTSKVLKSIEFNAFSDDFIFDNQILVEAFSHNFLISEITCPTRYDKDSSSINFMNSLKYGFGIIVISFRFFFQRIFIK